MRTEKNILIAFLLNLSFSLFEFWGGIFTGSMAILSDAIHDMGDAASIGISWFLEKKSKKQPDDRHTYGYLRYSVLGSLITTLFLIFGSVGVIYGAIGRIITPRSIHSSAMILFAMLGVCVNFCAALFTRDGSSLNQKAVNLHMLEDVLGWVVVLTGAVTMKWTGFTLIDPIMSIGVAVFILIHALCNLKYALDLFLEKTPAHLNIRKVETQLLSLEGVFGVHHIHIWSMDGLKHYATMHIVTDRNPSQIKAQIRQQLHENGIDHATIELEAIGEECHEKNCSVTLAPHCGHHHHGSPTLGK